MDLLQIATGLLVLAFTITVPGYCLSLAFFPKRKELEEFERFAFSFVFSITFLPLLVLIENQFFGWKIDFFTSLAAVALLVIPGIALWQHKKKELKKGEAAEIWLPKFLLKKSS